MNIGNVAKQSGVSAKTIRYYESIDLIPEAARGSNGYRDYRDQDVEILRFIARARNLGFPLKGVANLVALWQDKTRASSEVKALALSHIDEISHRIQEMQEIRQTLMELADQCQGDHRPDCPILAGLAGEAEA